MKLNVDLRITLGWFSGRVVGTVEVPCPAMPGPMKLTATGQEENVLKFKLVLPAPGASDVVSRELELKIGEAEPVLLTLAGGALESEEYSCADAATVLAKLTDIDDAGNRSVPREQSWTVTDTIAPPEPGEMGLTVTAEE